MSTIEDLYKYFGILADAKDDAGKHADVYLKIIESTKSGAKEKQLASQFITRFFKYFSKDTGTVAIDALFDLCEDDDVNIRKQAIKDLSTICKDCPEHINRIADILTQLLQTDDQHEALQVQSSLLTVLKQNPKSALTEIFNQINTAELEVIRKRAMKFLASKVPTLESSVLTKETEEFLIKQIKQVLVDVDGEEFTLLIKLLTCLPSMSTLIGRQDLVNIIVAQSELDKGFDANDNERLMILLSCTQQAMPLFSRNVHSTKFLLFYLDHVLSAFNKLTCDETLKLELIKCLAEMSSFLPSNAMDDYATRLSTLFNLLLEYLPHPSGNKESVDDAKLNFSFVECLLYTFHELGRLHPDFLTAETNKERLKDFKIRLQYFATGTQNYIKELRNTIIGNDKSEENKVKKVALKVTTNIDLLIKDFFHVPPSYKNSIILSWKAEQKTSGLNENSLKRSLSAEKSEGTTKKKPERDVYQPPSGKYSHVGASNDGHATGYGHANNSNGYKKAYGRNSNRF